MGTRDELGRLARFVVARASSRASTRCSRWRMPAGFAKLADGAVSNKIVIHA